MDFLPHSGIFHGAGKSAPYFESWYFKLISADQRRRFAILPGIILANEEDHAFVQVLNDHTGHSVYFEYPFLAFKANPEQFSFTINRKNQFSAERIAFDIAMEHGGVKGELRFLDPQPGPALLGADFSQGVISLGCRLEGELTIDSQQVDFTGGRGYIENTWGEAYPETYLWFQSNHFPQADTALVAAISSSREPGSATPNFSISLWREGSLLRFANDNGAQLQKYDVAEKQITCTVANDRHILEMFVTRPEGGLLRLPARQSLVRKAHHPLSASVHVRLLEAGQTVFEATGSSSALEVLK